MRRAAAGRQRGRRQAHRRGSLRDGLAGRYSILNCHDGEIAAVHGAGRLLTLDALHTTREADRRDPSRGLMVKDNAPSRASTGRSRARDATKPAHGRQRTIFTPLAKMINYVKQIFRVTRRVEFRKSGKRHDLGRTRLAATAARMESWTPGSREPSSCPRRHLPRRRLHAPNAPANNAITLAIIIRNKRKLPKPFNSFVDATMPTSAGRSCTQSQDQADRASLPDRNRKLSSPATKASRSPRIRRPIAPRAATARQQISKSQPRTRRPAPRSGLRSHHINKHETTLARTG